MAFADLLPNINRGSKLPIKKGSLFRATFKLIRNPDYSSAAI